MFLKLTNNKAEIMKMESAKYVKNPFRRKLSPNIAVYLTSVFKVEVVRDKINKKIKIKKILISLTGFIFLN